MVRKKQILILLAAVLVLAAILLLPWPTRIAQSYDCLLCSPDSFEDAEPVTVQFSGLYLDFLLLNDRYYGTIHLMDYPREGKNTGGKFEPLTLSPTSRDVVSGSLFYFKKMKYQFMGSIFWDRQGQRLLIASEDYNILCPTGTPAELETLYNDILQPD